MCHAPKPACLICCRRQMSHFCISYYHSLIMQKGRFFYLFIFVYLCTLAGTHVWKLEVNPVKLLSTLCFETGALTGLELAQRSWMPTDGSSCLCLPSRGANKSVPPSPPFPCGFRESSSGLHTCTIADSCCSGEDAFSVFITARGGLVQT